MNWLKRYFKLEELGTTPGREAMAGIVADATQRKGIDAQDFPIMPQPGEGDDTLPIPAAEFKEMIAMVAFAAARDDSRPVLTGVSISFQDGLLTMAAADGFSARLL